MISLKTDNRHPEEPRDYTIPQPPLCSIKKSKPLTRNNWCENNGDCSTCYIAKYHEVNQE